MPNEASSPPRPTETVTPIWHGLAAVHRQPNGKKRVRLRWLRLAGIAVVMVVTFWMMAALGLYFWFKLGRDFQDEQFSDMFFLWVPSKFEAHNHKLGEYYLRMADTHMKFQRVQQAFNDYRLGVEKTQDTPSAETLHGRTMLAEFYYIYYRNELDRSLKVLEDGLPYAVGTDRDYVDYYLSQLQSGHFPDKTIEVCKEYLDGPMATKCRPDVRMLFAIDLAQVYIDQGRFDDAESTLERFHLDQTLDGATLTSKLLWERGHLQDAAAYLAKAQLHFNTNDWHIFGLLARYYDDLGDLDKAQEYIIKWELSNPSDANPRIEMLKILAKEGDPSVPGKIDALIEQFHQDHNAMFALANFAVDQGNSGLANRLYKNAQEQADAQLKATQPQTFDIATYALIVAQAYLAKNDYQNALKFLDNVDQEKPHWLEDNRTQFDSLRALADYGLGNTQEMEMYLTKLVKADKTRPDTLITVANQFLTHGAAEQAQRLFEAAYQLDPHNQAALAQLITADLQLGNAEHMNEHITKLLTTRRPSLDLLYDAEHELGSDRFLFIPDREHLLAEIHLYILGATKNERPAGLAAQ